MGRFISQDPIGFAAGDPNFYRYVGNGASNAVDPSGLIGKLAPTVSPFEHRPFEHRPFEHRPFEHRQADSNGYDPNIGLDETYGGSGGRPIPSWLSGRPPKALPAEPTPLRRGEAIARRATPEDLVRFDWQRLNEIRRLLAGNPKNRVSLMMEYDTLHYKLDPRGFYYEKYKLGLVAVQDMAGAATALPIRRGASPSHASLARRPSSATNSGLADLPYPTQHNQGFVRAKELLEATNIQRLHPINSAT